MLYHSTFQHWNCKENFQTGVVRGSCTAKHHNNQVCSIGARGTIFQVWQRVFDVEIETEPHHHQHIYPTNQTLRFKSAQCEEIPDSIAFARTGHTTNRHTGWGVILFRGTRPTKAISIFKYPFK